MQINSYPLVVVFSLCAAQACKPRTDAHADAPQSAAATSAQPAPAPVKPVPDAARVTVKNVTAEPRASETIVISTEELRKLWIEPGKALVFDAAGKPVVSQLVDLTGDLAPDELVFQTDLGPSESKTFGLKVGTRALPTREQFKVYGRFVRERHDDFAWENDRIARRAYGPALETWHKEPLTSSGLDVWTKRVPKLVISDWYMTNTYHEDSGEGGDFYSVGKTRGCGGVGIWAGDQLHVSKNFRTSRVLATGPLRLVFELNYEPWDVGGGKKVAETRRVILDGGKNFERFESTFTVQGRPAELQVGIGTAVHPGSTIEHDVKAGWLRSWEPFKDQKNGNLGCGIVLPPNTAAEFRQTDSDHLLVARTPAQGPFVFHAGFGWDKSPEFPDAAAWTRRVKAHAREIAAPAAVSIVKVDAKPWGARMCDSLMSRHQNVLTDEWDYDTGLELRGCEQIALKTNAAGYADYVKRTIDGLVNPDGTIKGYKLDDYNIDNVNMGKVIYRLLAQTNVPAEKERYTKALQLLRSQMATHPRTKEGGFWHKKIYPHQMWLDGLYMASPFLAQFAVTFDEPKLFDDVTHQIVLIEKHTRDPKTGLLYHGWDESKEQRWANPKTGASPAFWGRAMGWYAMAVVDVLEFLPKDHPKRAAVLGVLERMAAAIASVQDRDKGVWWQVLDAPKKGKNFLEASASSMFVYSLSKAIRNGWLPREAYEPVVARGWEGILREFVEIEANGNLNLKKVCKVAGLGVGPKGGPHRDGTFEYYTGELAPPVVNDPKGVGAFILASVERDL